MKLLANCQPSGQKIRALRPPEAGLFTASAASATVSVERRAVYLIISTAPL